MPYITSVERIGRIQQGRAILARQIAKKFNSQLEHELSNLEKLNADDLLELGKTFWILNRWNRLISGLISELPGTKRHRRN
ncbi:MAG: hypothetical protein GY795_28340 [Desulfobacterales bacterium]|nr:hypothetical protein [Desulfobacterales bacterium]